MKPTVEIRFPALSDPAHQGSVTTDANDIDVTIKTTDVIQYTQTVITLNTPVATRATVHIPETGLYLFLLVTGNLIVERAEASGIPFAPSDNHCQAFYITQGNYSVTFKSGKHRLVSYALCTAWMTRLQRTLPFIHTVSASITPYQEALIFPRYSLSNALMERIISLSFQSAYDEDGVELEYSHHLDHIMAFYDNLMVKARHATEPKMQYREIVLRFIAHCNRLFPTNSQRSVKAVAATIGVSLKTLNRAFHSLSNGKITAGQLLRQIRMTAAHRLLTDENGGMTVGDVAHLLGYGETSAFTKAYRQTCGHLPSEAHRFSAEDLPQIELPCPE
ncbi:helix-turn-helix transcriptional regulator [Sphingobacterium sp. SGG-5]|uniref:helix-turn-helix transcriptional regulator n=1 Tax=Sphingobacterium sp. SGG-5 TaxID=2710881 RepID=UPI0013EBB3E0|nr:helix-turn-helix transcriptional regulator [Sphingobacterium sp. SGG-5]NGM61248.1 helix-turn-helix transcriptional regulator [Sphingobacterium sp. SGG-5]